MYGKRRMIYEQTFIKIGTQRQLHFVLESDVKQVRYVSRAIIRKMIAPVHPDELFSCLNAGCMPGRIPAIFFDFSFLE